MYKYLIITSLSILPIITGAQIKYDRIRLQNYYQNQEVEQALLFLKSVSDSGSIQYRFDLSYAYYVNGQLKEAKDGFRTLYVQDPTAPIPQLYLAMLFEQFRNYDSALYYYRNLTQLLPQRYLYWQRAAEQWNRLKQYDSSFQYIKRAYTINPAVGSVVVSYALALKRDKRVKEAEQIIDTYLMHNPNDAAVASQKVSICMDDGRFKEVILWGELLRKNNSFTPNAYINLAFSYLNIGKPDSVFKLRDWLISRDMDGEPVQYCAALAYSHLKNYDTSNSLLDDCLSNNILPDAITYYRAKAENFEAKKNYLKASSFYDTSYYIFKDPLDLYLSGKIYDEKLKNKAKASIYYKKFLAAVPKPASNDEKRITGYIKEYLKP